MGAENVLKFVVYDNFLKKNYMILAGALFMKQLAQQIKDSNGDYSNLEGSPLLSPKVLMSNCVSDLNNMAETQAEIKVKIQILIQGSVL